MITENNIKLLRLLFNTLIGLFIVNREGSYGTLAKQSKIRECHKSIMTYITTRENSIFTIETNDKELSINIRNIEEDNDHIQYFLITISEDGESFAVDEIIYHEKVTKRNIIKFKE